MGTSKQLLPLQGKPVILHCLDAFRRAGFGSPVVVLSPDGEEIAGILAGSSSTIAWNEELDCEMADSVRNGFASSSPSCSGFIICPADYPLLNPATISGLAELHAAVPGKIVIPVCRGRRGHPALFPRGLLEELHPQHTLRDLVRCHPEQVMTFPVDDEGILYDMDTPADYDFLCRKAEREMVR